MKIKTTAWLASLVGCGLLLGSCVPNEEPIIVESIAIAPSANLDLEVGQTATLSAVVLPENATNKDVTWLSSDTSVASVANGLVTALKVGVARISLTSVANPTLSSYVDLRVSKQFAWEELIGEVEDALALDLAKIPEIKGFSNAVVTTAATQASIKLTFDNNQDVVSAFAEDLKVDHFYVYALEGVDGLGAQNMHSGFELTFTASGSKEATLLVKKATYRTWEEAVSRAELAIGMPTVDLPKPDLSDVDLLVSRISTEYKFSWIELYNYPETLMADYEAALVENGYSIFLNSANDLVYALNLESGYSVKLMEFVESEGYHMPFMVIELDSMYNLTDFVSWEVAVQRAEARIGYDLSILPELETTSELGLALELFPEHYYASIIIMGASDAERLAYLEELAGLGFSNGTNVDSGEYLYSPDRSFYINTRFNPEKYDGTPQNVTLSIYGVEEAKVGTYLEAIDFMEADLGVNLSVLKAKVLSSEDTTKILFAHDAHPRLNGAVINIRGGVSNEAYLGLLSDLSAAGFVKARSEAFRETYFAPGDAYTIDVVNFPNPDWGSYNLKLRVRTGLVKTDVFDVDLAPDFDAIGAINHALYLEKTRVLNENFVPAFNGTKTGFRIEINPDAYGFGYQLRVKGTDQASVDAFNLALKNAGFSIYEWGYDDGDLIKDTIQVRHMELQSNGDALLKFSYYLP